MSETKRFTPDNSGSMLAAVVWDSDGGWVRLKDHEVEMERLTSKRDAAQAEVERLTVERDTARAEVRRLIAERDQPEARPKGREVGRFGLDGHYLDYEALKPTRPTDEDIWREIFLQCISDYMTADRRVIIADTMLAEYRKRWPR